MRPCATQPIAAGIFMDLSAAIGCGGWARACSIVDSSKDAKVVFGSETEHADVRKKVEVSEMTVMSRCNRDIARQVFSALPASLFVKAVGDAIARIGFGYNGYNCLYGRDGEADSGERFDGVWLLLINEERVIPELDLFEGVLEACAEFLAKYPDWAPRLEDKVGAITGEIALLRSRTHT